MLAPSSTQPLMHSQCEYSTSATHPVRSRVCALVLIVIPAMAGAASGQEPAARDTAAAGRLPFRRGQWGAEITLFTGFRMGLLRFSTPTQAWLLDVALAAAAERSSDPNGATRTAGSANAFMRIGRRRYRPLVRRTDDVQARVAAFGAVGGFVSGSWASGSGLSARQTRGAVGVFVEPGATTFVTEYLALNASIEGIVEGEYATTTYVLSTGREKSISRRASIRVGAVRVFGSVFF